MADSKMAYGRSEFEISNFRFQRTKEWPMARWAMGKFDKVSDKVCDKARDALRVLIMKETSEDPLDAMRNAQLPNSTKVMRQSFLRELWLL